MAVVYEAGNHALGEAQMLKVQACLHSRRLAQNGMGWGDAWGGVGHDSQPKPTGRFEDPRNLVEGAVGMGDTSVLPGFYHHRQTPTAALQTQVSVGEPGEGTV